MFIVNTDTKENNANNNAIYDYMSVVHDIRSI